MSKGIANEARRLGPVAAAAVLAASVVTVLPQAAFAASAASTPPTTHNCTSPSSVVPYDRNNAQSGVFRDAYYVTNDTWNASNYPVSQHLYVCNYNDWYVIAKMNNDSGDGAVKTSPNVHLYFNEPRISSYKTITSDFSDIGPGIGSKYGIWEFEYDCWLNGVATNGSTEIMIWTDNNGQTPGGSVVAHASFDGRKYSVWKSGSYIAFEARHNVSSGQVNLLDFFNYVMSKGWMPTGSTIGQIDYGIELVSTRNVNEKFIFNNFDINAHKG